VEETKDSVKKQLLTVNEVAERLNVTPQMVRALIKNGKLGSYKIGQRSTRISQEDLEKYLESCKINQEA
jgi:DNA binding domain, excisionase family